jgi:DNA-binding NarL/FixJ family response regulator
MSAPLLSDYDSKRTDEDPAAPTCLRVRVLAVDSEDIVRAGLRVMLGLLPWVERCVPARTISEALAATRRYEPHVALVASSVDGIPASRLCWELSLLSPAPRVVLLAQSQFESPEHARAAGAIGYVHRGAPAAVIASTIKAAAQGWQVFPDGPSVQFDERELTVLPLLAAGATNREIGFALGLSVHTIKDRTRGLYRKLGVRNRTEAVTEAQRLGLIRC